MKKKLLIKILKHMSTNQNSKHVRELIVQLCDDNTLHKIVTMDSFSNEFYSVRSIRWIKQVFNLRLM